MLFKICLLIMAFILIGFIVNANTGSLDHRDSHNCWINCEQRGLYQGEYHMHYGPDKFHRD